jgi:neutral ceramidase
MTNIIGERQFNRDVDLFMSATKDLTGKDRYRQNFSQIVAEF